MTFEELILEYKYNQGTQIEYYEMDRNGIIKSLVQQMVFGTLKIKQPNKIVLYLSCGNEFKTKQFNNLEDCIKFLEINEIKFKEIIPSNLGKIFSISI